MPGLGGRELAQRVSVARPATGVVYMTGYAEVGLRDHALAARAEVLLKPFVPLSLLRAVRSALARQPHALPA